MVAGDMTPCITKSSAAMTLITKDGHTFVLLGDEFNNLWIVSKLRNDIKSKYLFMFQQSIFAHNS